jgi:hypothetical protein
MLPVLAQVQVEVVAVQLSLVLVEEAAVAQDTLR